MSPAMPMAVGTGWGGDEDPEAGSASLDGG